MYFLEDEILAENLQRSFNVNRTYYPAISGRENIKVTDPQLEYHDPTPSIHELFVLFDKQYFWGKLGMVEVKWSHKMTKCAGLCSYQGKRGLCSIRLSAPLLSLRPRKDLVETLLHEMIHAYLFVTENNVDREGHGPEFRSHMQRINNEAGTNITIYHDFVDEVAYYQRHIWRCNGRCQNKRPYFGFIKRAINKAPGPYDFWWKEHQNNCGGTFIKVSEPQKHCKKNTKQDKGKTVKNQSETRGIEAYFRFENNKIMPSMDFKKEKTNTQNINNLKGLNGFHNSLEGRVPGVTKSDKTYVTKTETQKKLSDDKDAIECLRVRETVRNAWANKYLTPSKIENKPNSLNVCSPVTTEMKRSQVKCPVCFEPCTETVINEHIDECLSKEKCMEIVNEAIPEEETKQGRSQVFYEESLKDKLVSCPVCRKVILGKILNEHLEVCLNINFENNDTPHNDYETGCDKVPCPCCFKWVPEKSINDHINVCLTHGFEGSSKSD